MKDILYHSGICQSAIVKSSDMPFDKTLTKYCKENLCGRYNTTWNCPPAVGSFEELKEKAEKFSHAFIFTHCENAENVYDEKEMDKVRNHAMAILFDICDKLMKSNIPHMALGCSSCKICKKCTYPNSPCRFPEKAVPSVEALGIDMMKLAASASLNYNNGENTVTFFLIVFYDNNM